MCLPIQKQDWTATLNSPIFTKWGSGLPTVWVVTASDTPADCDVPTTKSSWSDPRWALGSLHAHVKDGELRGFQKCLVCGVIWFPHVLATHWLLAPLHQSQNAAFTTWYCILSHWVTRLHLRGTTQWLQTVIINSDCMLVIAPCKYIAFQRKKRSLDVYKPIR